MIFDLGCRTRRAVPYKAIVIEPAIQRTRTFVLNYIECRNEHLNQGLYRRLYIDIAKHGCTYLVHLLFISLVSSYSSEAFIEREELMNTN